ncbi:thiamine pyrophosphate-binding protein [Allosphingosinicella indica]|uniref:Acetolactate synthase-1/2/3 large subunit n=1 Tax=Allosphingosinicella indica TaxID=941907 RepID=A0A1X7GU15_9SPHN|nr:thiamine pyrophosphate-binding protein [Allosphingosinicella indica]SMF74553.1 acetolactate synthase-1/2/3 large subunit [Allosphingosinicella indica]
MTQLRTGGRILIDNLLAQGCDRIFCVPGESYLAALDALHDTPAIDLVVCRQEGGVAYMAEADGKMTGRPGVAFVTRGPGATNASVGVHVARQDSTPMVLLIGDVARGDRDREGFQEVDFLTMFAPLAKWVARIEDARRIPEYVARAWRTATAGRPGPVVLVLPEDMLRDEVEAVDRPANPCIAQAADPLAVGSLMTLLQDACAPLAIVGGGGWCSGAGHYFRDFAERIGLPVATAFRRQDAIGADSPVYAGNLGYGPNPKLVERVKNADLLLVVGARLGEATTDGYTLIAPDHPGQTLVHVHPDPNELGSVYRTDLPICADMREFAELVADWEEQEVISFDAGAEAHREWLEWSMPRATGGPLDLGLVVEAMRDALPADTIICNGAGNFSGWWHRFWPYAALPSQLAPTNGSMGYGPPAAVAAALRFPDRTVVAVAGDGDFLMNGQELATAMRHDTDMLVLVIDNASYGTIRMHQEREYPERVVGTGLVNPDFAQFAKAFGAWSESVERTEDFRPALDRAMATRGVRFLHLKTDVEQITNGTTIAKIRARQR